MGIFNFCSGMAKTRCSIMSRQINAYRVKFVKQWEGVKDTAYQDSNGIWTLGFGPENFKKSK